MTLRATTSNRYSFGRLKQILEMPNFIAVQRDSFDKFLREGLTHAFRDISPISDYAGKLHLEFDFDSSDEDLLPPPKFTVGECKEKDMTYSAPVFARARFLNANTGEIKEQVVFMGDFPMMTEHGTFVVNGTERVVVSQLVRSPGVIFQPGERYRLRNFAKHQLVTGTIHPYRGEWVEFDVEQKPRKEVTAGVRVARKRRLPLFALLRALGYDEESHPDFIPRFVEHFDFLEEQWEKQGHIGPTRQEALVEIYKRVRPGEPVSPETARSYFESSFFNPRRYDLSRVGRHKLNRKLDEELAFLDETFNLGLREVDPENPDAVPPELRLPTSDQSVLSPCEMLAAATYMLNLAKGEPGYRLDDQDHFANRRIRSVGELIQNQVRIGLSRMERVVRDRMTTQDVEGHNPADADQHPPDGGDDQGVLRFFATVAVHGPDQSVVRSHAPTPYLGVGPRWPESRTCRLRGTRCALLPLRAHVSYRDARRPEHRIDRWVRLVRAGQRLRIHRVALPGGEGRRGYRRDRLLGS